MFLPATKICPAVGCSSRIKSLMRVDLPEPDGPTTKTNSPFVTSTETSWRAATSAVLVVLPQGDPVEHLIERSGARVVPVQRAGYGEALNAGLAASTGRWVVTMDADYSHHPEFVRTLWLNRNSADVLIASRF